MPFTAAELAPGEDELRIPSMPVEKFPLESVVPSTPPVAPVVAVAEPLSAVAFALDASTSSPTTAVVSKVVLAVAEFVWPVPAFPMIRDEPLLEPAFGTMTSAASAAAASATRANPVVFISPPQGRRRHQLTTRLAPKQPRRRQAGSGEERGVVP